MSLRVLIADDHAILREGLRSMLDREPNITVVGEAEDGRKACDLAHELEPDVVVMDIQMPGLNGLDATRKILQHKPNIRVLVLSMYTDRRFVIQALDAGARGYVTKDGTYDEILQAARTVARGGIYLSPQVADSAMARYLGRVSAERRPAMVALSTREREVLQLMAEGTSTRNIAADLGISIKTAESHRLNIMRKLDLRSVAELTKFAIREGLTSLDS